MVQAVRSKTKQFQREDIYTADEIGHYQRSKTIQRFVAGKTAQSRATGKSYRSRLANLGQFIFRKHGKCEIDDAVLDMKSGKLEPYEFLTEFVIYLKGSRRLSANMTRVVTITAKKFLRVSGVKIDNEDFRDLVSLPRKEHREKTGLEKEDVIEILNGLKDIRLKSTVMLLTATGPRPIEACALRLKDIKLDTDPATVTFRAEFTKMRVERTRPLTRECANQLRLWLDYKYRTHRTSVKDEAGKYVNRLVTPERNPEDLAFAMLHLTGQIPDPQYVYGNIAKEFAIAVDMLGKGEREDGDRRRKITLHGFRSFVKTTYSNLGQRDFGEWYIGHGLGDSSNTYYRNSKKDTVTLFRQLEPYFTYLDARQLNASTADIRAENEALKITVLKVKDEVRELQTYKDNFEKVVSFMKVVFPEKAMEIENLSKQR